MKKFRRRPPKVEERENSVIVHIRHPPLASPHDVVIGFRDLTGIGTENVVKQVFLDLNARKLLERVQEKGEARRLGENTAAIGKSTLMRASQTIKKRMTGKIHHR